MYTFSKWNLKKRAGNMCNNLYVCWYATAFPKDFQSLNITCFKNSHQFTEIKYSKLPNMHKGSYTGELHCLLLQPWRQPYLIRWCLWYGGPQWTVHSSVYLYQSQFSGLGNHFPCSSADPHTKAFICCLLNVLVQSHLRKGCLFIEQTFLVNKCFLAISKFV